MNICHQSSLFSRSSISYISDFSSPENSQFGALEPLILAILKVTKNNLGISGGGVEVEEERDFSKGLMKLPILFPSAAVVVSGYCSTDGS